MKEEINPKEQKKKRGQEQEAVVELLKAARA